MDRPVPAKLVVIGCALAGEVFSLEVEERTLGRDASNTIAADVSLAATGNCTEAAELLGVHPNYFHPLIRNLNITATLEQAEA